MTDKFVLNCKFVIRDILNLLRKGIPNVCKIKKDNRLGRQIIYLLDIPTYSNLGDQAIGYAEHVFIQHNFPDAEIIEVEGYMMKYYIGFMARNVQQKDLIVYIGGGNFGDTYMNIEANRIRVINELAGRRVILFPQTIYYSDTVFGHNRLDVAKKALASNPDVLIAAREQASYEFAKRNFDARVVLCPDIVLFLKEEQKNVCRKGVLLCLRDDLEKKVDYSANIKKLLNEKNLNYSETDTISNSKFTLSERERILKDKWSEFSHSELVITDRLHGMIFSVITRTACLVLPNYNYKIESFYNTWLQDVNFIQFSKSASDFNNKLNYLVALKSEEYTQTNFEKYYEVLLDNML